MAITRELEERLAAHKGQEDAMIFPSGFSANLALPGALARNGDRMYYDAYSHASWFDGLKLAGLSSRRFPHNDLQHLAHWLERRGRCEQDTFVAVEGVYSMDGDLAPLDQLVPLCKRHSALLVVDDAHGTGVLGTHGGGSGEHFGVAQGIDLLMGTLQQDLGCQWRLRVRFASADRVSALDLALVHVLRRIAAGHDRGGAWRIGCHRRRA